MEWVETTARTVEEAQELALDQLGVIADEAEFEVLTTPKPGLFGRLRGEARVRARVRPTPRPAEAGSPARTASAADAKRRARTEAIVVRRPATAGRDPVTVSTEPARPGGATMTTTDAPAPSDDGTRRRCGPPSGRRVRERADRRVRLRHHGRGRPSRAPRSRCASTAPRSGCSSGRVVARCSPSRTSPGSPPSAGSATTTPACGSTWPATARSAARRSSGSPPRWPSRCKSSGVARSLDPMPSADRKVLHDALAAIDGVTSRSEGEDPNRRVVVAPA